MQVFLYTENMNPWLIQSDPIEIFRWATFSLIPSNKYVIDEKVNVVGVQSNTNVSNNGPNNTLPCCIIIQYETYQEVLQGPLTRQLMKKYQSAPRLVFPPQGIYSFEEDGGGLHLQSSTLYTRSIDIAVYSAVNLCKISRK